MIRRIRLMDVRVAGRVSAREPTRIGVGVGVGIGMVKLPTFLVRALLCGAMLSIGSPQLLAATSSLEVLPAERPDFADPVDIGRLKPLARPAQEPARAVPSGNPLWAVPLSTLTATGARPIFSASRRPPAPAVVAPVMVAAPPPPPTPVVPERLTLALVGAVVGDNDAIAVLLDQATQKVIRLKQGESHGGWQLDAVQPREVTFKKAGRSETLTLQRQQPTAVAGPPGFMPVVNGPPPLAVMPQPAVPMVPVPGAVNGAYAPFTPRSTPKNGESDGL